MTAKDGEAYGRFELRQNRKASLLWLMTAKDGEAYGRLKLQ